MVFPKKFHWNMIFPLLSGMVMFLFPKNLILPPGRKRKDDLSQKNTWKYDIFFKCSEKLVFSKKLCWNMIFLVLSGKMVFSSPKTWYFFFGRKMKDDLSQGIHGNMIFSVHTYRRYKHGAVPLCKKKINKRWSYPQKYT